MRSKTEIQAQHLLSIFFLRPPRRVFSKESKHHPQNRQTKNLPKRNFHHGAVLDNLKISKKIRHVCCEHACLVTRRRPTVAVSLQEVFIRFTGRCTQACKMNLMNNTISHTTQQGCPRTPKNSTLLLLPGAPAL